MIYTLTFISGNGCDTLRTSLNIDVQPGIEVSLETDSPGLDPAQQGTPITLTALASQPSPLDFTWTLNQEILQQGADLFEYEDILISDPSVYTVLAQNPESGCSDTASLLINVTLPVIEVPNTFTPNGDGYNDFFSYVILGNVRRILTFRVFNRWGQLVYEESNSDPANSTGWDGAFNGKPQPSEVYFYQLRLEQYDGEVVKMQGDVSLLR